MRRYARDFLFSNHYREEKDIDTSLVIDCIHTGKKQLDAEPNKFKSIKKYRCGGLVVIYNEFDDCFFVITAFWNTRGDKNEI